MVSLDIVFPLYAGVTQLDFTGPHQVFARIPESRVRLASLGGTDIEADGIVFTGLARLEDMARCDVLCVPGGGGVAGAMQDRALLRQVRRLATEARGVSSVCTGSLILAAAGLLEGRRASCHWAWRDMLAWFGAIPDTARVSRDGRFITGGGVTAGIDMALTLVAELLDTGTAQAIQLLLEYAPAPPFDSGRPETAPAAVLEHVRQRLAGTLPAQRAMIERLAAERRRGEAD